MSFRLPRLLGATILSLSVSTVMVTAAVVQIDQHGLRFSESSRSLRLGDHLIFRNSDDVQHNIKVINADGDEDDQGLQTPGETIDVRFDTAGRFTVRCAIHPQMKMHVEVR